MPAASRPENNGLGNISMTERLQALQEEYKKGQQMLLELDQRRAQLHNTLLRISGAIQVLQELGGGKESEEALIMNGDS